jgi:MFS family permease
MPRARTIKNILLLSICQALALSCLSLVMTVSALVGNSLAPEPSLATFPLALQFVGVMVTTLPASLFMQRFGRRTGFSLGALFGLCAGAISCWAIFQESFYLFCLGSFLTGSFAAHAAYYRFAAADTASDAAKSRAISLVLAGGLVAAFLGPELAKQTRDLFAPVMFAGGYLAVAFLAVASLVVLQFIDIPRPDRREFSSSGRSFSELLRQPALIVSMLCAMVGYGAMNLVMVSTPLAMVSHAHAFESAAMVIQWHVVGMYAPSFFTGHLIDRFGAVPILGLGALLILACVGVNLSGVGVVQFWSALVLLGLGWNFLFVGGTTLLTNTYRPEEKAKVQGLNDFLVFSTTAFTAFTSGALFNHFGWTAVNLAVVVPLCLTLIAIVWLARQPAPVTALSPRGMEFR